MACADVQAFFDCQENPEQIWCVTSVPDFRDLIPPRGYDEEVAKLAGPDRSTVVAFRSCSGPAVLRVRNLVFFFLIISFALLYGSMKTADCNDDGFARIKTVWWLIMIPLGIFRVYEERQIHRYITIPYIQIRGTFGPPGLPVDYNLWIIWMHSITLVQLLDFCSDTFFVARTYSSEQCNNYLMTRIWAEVTAHSMFRHLSINFACLVLASFVLMVIQFINSLLEATPRPSEWGKVDYEIGIEKENGTPLCQDFTNCFGTETNCGDALCSLAEGVGFGSLLQVGLLFPRAKEQFKRHHPGLRAASSVLPQGSSIELPQLTSVEDAETSSLQETGQPNVAASDSDLAAYGSASSDIPLNGVFSRPRHRFNAHDSLKYLHNSLQRGFARVGLVALLENALQVNLQITVLALRLAAVGHGYKGDPEDRPAPTAAEISSVTLSVIMAILKVNEAFFLLRFSACVRKAICEQHDEEPGSIFCFNGPPSLQEESKGIYRQIMFLTWLIRLIGVMLVATTGYALAKYYAVFHCEYSVWNISGCVDLGPMLAKHHYTGHVSP